MITPVYDWKKFDPENIPEELLYRSLNGDETYLVIVAEHDYYDSSKIEYHVDFGWPFGSYIDNFWNTENDWIEGQEVHVVAYADPCSPVGWKETEET